MEAAINRLLELRKKKSEVEIEIDKLKNMAEHIRRKTDSEYMNLMDSLVAPYVGKFYVYKHPTDRGNLAFKITDTPIKSWTGNDGCEYRDHEIPVLMLTRSDRYRGNDNPLSKGLNIVPDYIVTYPPRRDHKQMAELSAFDHFKIFLEDECIEITESDFLDMIRLESETLMSIEVNEKKGEPKEDLVEVDDSEEE